MPARGLVCPAVLVLSLGILAAAPAGAQPQAEESLAVTLGARVRVTTTRPLPGGSGPVFVGRLAGSDPDQLTMAVSSGEIVAVPRNAIVRFEHSVGPSRKGRGALIGFGIGLAAMLGKAALQGGCNDGCNSANVLAAGLFGLSTAVVGAIAAPGERWADVTVAGERSDVAPPADSRLRVRFVPQVGRRTGLTLVATF